MSTDNPDTGINVAPVVALLTSCLLFCLQSAAASELRLEEVTGLPGEVITVMLVVDELPLDGSGLFTLDADLAFDETVIAVGEVRGGPLTAGADFFTVDAVPPLNPASQSPVFLSIIGGFTTGPSSARVPAPPGGGVLLEIDITVAATAQPGQRSPLDLIFIDHNTDALSAESLIDGGLTVPGDVEQVPMLPLPAAITLGALLLVAASRARRNQVKSRPN